MAKDNDLSILSEAIRQTGDALRDQIANERIAWLEALPIIAQIARTIINLRQQ